jgi:hypothetical protein
MTQVASEATVRADFDGVQVDDGRGNAMQLTRRAGQFWAEFDDPDAERPARIARQVLLTTGSHSQQVYWYHAGKGRVVGPLPALYLIGERRWIPRESAFLRPPVVERSSETGRWNLVCIDCHTTHGRSGVDKAADILAQAPDTSVAEFGIACEACHGPAERHQAMFRNPIRRYLFRFTRSFEPTIVEPRRLAPQLSSQVCGQCHSVWLPSDANARQQVAMPGHAYRPGEDLAKSRFIVQPSRDLNSPRLQQVLADYPTFLRDSFWPDGMVRVSGREYNGLVDSPCFKDATTSVRTLSCMSCHTMHQPEDDPRPVSVWADAHQVAAPMAGNEACVQCHSTFQSNISAHTHHGPQSSGSTCYNCHMPYTSYGLLRALRSHQISSPDVGVVIQTGRPDACSLCHLDKSLRWTAEHLEHWYGIASPPLDPDEASIAASLLWLLRGDAGQRALGAWAMGWAPARQASGDSWMAPYLGILRDDPYDAVRIIAGRSLGAVRGSADTRRRTDAGLLMDATGTPRRDDYRRLIDQRDDRDVSLNE